MLDADRGRRLGRGRNREDIDYAGTVRGDYGFAGAGINSSAGGDRIGGDGLRHAIIDDIHDGGVVAGCIGRDGQTRLRIHRDTLRTRSDSKLGFRAEAGAVRQIDHGNIVAWLTCRTRLGHKSDIVRDTSNHYDIDGDTLGRRVGAAGDQVHGLNDLQACGVGER